VEKTGFTLEGRVLCSDDSCIGTVGPDGKCKECGREYSGDEPLDPVAAGRSREGDDQLADPDPADDAEDPGDGSDERVDGDGGQDPDARVCCPDEACVGVIGPGGKCGTCGRQA